MRSIPCLKDENNGKKHIKLEIIILDMEPVPNHKVRIGAIATIGIVLIITAPVSSIAADGDMITETTANEKPNNKPRHNPIIET